MRLAITGVTGMLGREACEAAAHHAAVDEVLAVTHPMADIADPGRLIEALGDFRPDVVLNCAGITTHDSRLEDIELVARANGIGPHVLAEVCEVLGARVVLVSTDCVFSGERPFSAPYTVEDRPDPAGVYGITKRLGEVEAAHVAVVRTSFIGPAQGLWDWLASSTGTVDGWRHAYWSGSTVDAVAERLVDVAARFDQGDIRPGLHHLATERVTTKHDVLVALRDAFDLYRVAIKPTWRPYINRALSPTLPPLPPFDDALRAHLERRGLVDLHRTS